jgi:hypothetical protein
MKKMTHMFASLFIWTSCIGFWYLILPPRAVELLQYFLVAVIVFSLIILTSSIIVKQSRKWLMKNYKWTKKILK